MGSDFLAGVKHIRVVMKRDRPAKRMLRRNSDVAGKIYPTTKNTAVPAGGGLIRSISGATAHVATRAAHAFQCLVDRLEAAGYPIRFMGGWRAHGSVRGSLHPAGLALDVNQLARNRTRPAMPSNEIALANSCGLVSGAQWHWADSGHFQLGGWPGASGHVTASQADGTRRCERARRKPAPRFL
jgi:hypothetical protein